LDVRHRTSDVVAEAILATALQELRGGFILPRRDRRFIRLKMTIEIISCISPF
jgi:hypothetical protein